MSGGDFSDDHVAELLKQDAKRSAKNYSLLGSSAYLTQRPSVKAPKPNTRFLRHLIKETDSHNAALLAKEAEDAKARLKSFDREQRFLGHKDERQTKKRRLDGDSHPKEGYREDRDSGREKQRSRRERSVSTGDDRRRRRRSRELRRSDHSTGQDSRHHRRHKESSSKRRRSRSPESERRKSRERRRKEATSNADDTERRRHSDKPSRRHHHRTRSESPRRHRDRSPGESSSSRKHTSRTRPVTKPSSSYHDEATEGPPTPSSTSTDPLDEFIGPIKPKPSKIRSRGRGTFNAGTSLDQRFSSSYDPSLDIGLDEVEGDDWDQALEAMRDRMKWQKQGADRLRAAGFTEEEVAKWEKGGEKDEEDVRWRKKGEGREWDRGKVVDPEGEVVTQVEWGRLKGT